MLYNFSNALIENGEILPQAWMTATNTSALPTVVTKLYMTVIYIEVTIIQCFGRI